MKMVHFTILELRVRNGHGQTHIRLESFNASLHPSVVDPLKT